MIPEQVANYRVDRSQFARGPWDTEPDRIDFECEGFPCLIVRNGMGALCGYVAVPRSHPLHGTTYDKVDVDVHGELTYSDACAGHICHVHKPGEPDDVWWFGFDCAHGGDLLPSSRHRSSWRDENYRDVPYVTREVQKLARHLREVAS